MSTPGRIAAPSAPRGAWRRTSLARTQVELIVPGYERCKRIFDLALAILLLPIAIPILCATAAAVWLSDGRPLLFAQLRTGRGGRRFPIYKFRTMVADAQELKVAYGHLNRLSGPDFKIDSDPRITRIGSFLRRTSLDELPQIFNVLKGQMSFVGPRPTSFAPSTYSLWHTERLEVVPGITGLWQVNGRSDVDFDERVRLDIEYVASRSMKTDLRILLQTPRAILNQRGAY